MGPLAGIRVLELGSFIAAPFATQLLGDLGAEIVKVEPPGEGDAMRQWRAGKDGRSLWWLVIGRNKQSISINLRHPRGKELARKLALAADVLVENFRPGVLEKLGFDPAELAKEHPRLIVARVSGFGQEGPYRDRAGFGSVAEAMAGLRYLIGFADRPPPRIGLSIGDSLTGLLTVVGILAALVERQQSGQGQIVDVALTDAVMAVLESVLIEYSLRGQIRERTGNILPGLAPSNIYPTNDGQWILIGANADGLFKRLAEAMGQPELAQNPRYATHLARGEHQAELDDLIAAWTRRHSLAELDDLMARYGVPAGAVQNARGVVENPHFRARDAVMPVETDLGTAWMQGVFPKLSRTPGAIRWPGPDLGAHTATILHDLLGLSEEEIDSLRRDGVVA